jgi:hypothetical protein
MTAYKTINLKLKKIRRRVLRKISVSGGLLKDIDDGITTIVFSTFKGKRKLSFLLMAIPAGSAG